MEAKKLLNYWVINKESNPKACWYILHTYSGYEQRVTRVLQQRIRSFKQEDKFFEILIPTEKKMQIRGGKRFTKEEMLFPGYIFIKMILDDSSWVVARETQGVTGFVGVEDKPTPVINKEVRAIKQYLLVEKPKFKVSFSVGEAVKIIDGPFVDFLGTIDSIDKEKGKLKVMVSIFGRETPVELDFLQVRKI
ncbi:transcription termination/antitermination protein NusG [Candidatus Shapirobacteria bacterium CG09_land_8_20_14_0_10_38_17]|uniref:Transcription termination/antitermination protein NusG n=1 Tax=Candidatus Shapirobacteria bacterium CG09_land_8_20_14_0_10_38_17 TaxID=1974884 RepID=A0A2H0WRQ9_9BACT|nr:MAG: transcription termination/antitermination protein NusG [Candidatus Shapirobacteria bacterium CG09_land_8_20_14_0_10_38_17]